MEDSDPRRITGYVRGLRERQEPGMDSRQTQIWSFRVESYDADGNPRQSIPIVMRGKYLRGALYEGARVMVPGRWRRGTELETSRVWNIDTQSWVTTKSTGSSPP